VSLWAIATFRSFSCVPLLRTFFGAVNGTQHDRKGHTAAQLLSSTGRARRRSIAAAGDLFSLIGLVVLWILPPVSLLVLLASLVAQRWGPAARLAGIDLGILAAVGAFVYVRVRWDRLARRKKYTLKERLLRRFDLDAELASSYDLEQFFVRNFDTSFYGHLDVADAVKRGLERSPRPQRQECGHTGKPLGAYHDATSICVAPAVADLGTGQLRLLGPEVSVVEALMASMAVAPFFRARTLQTGGEADKHHSFVDGVNVANEPISALMNYLRKHVHEQAHRVTVYTVAPFPSAGAGFDSGDFSELMDVVDRVMAIQRVQTVGLERDLSKVYSRLLPSRLAVTRLPNAPDEEPYVNAHITPIDSDEKLDINRKLLAAQDQGERARIIYRGIAAGCRATLCETLGGELQKLAGGAATVKCREAMQDFWKHKFDRKALPLFGSAVDSGPGLSEVCRECSITLTDGAETHTTAVSLHVPIDKPPERRRKRRPPVRKPQPQPWVAMALSGGVFRGVFQLGVLNALSELNVRPRLFAGSSVGSIMAAFGARLTGTDDADARRRIVRSAAQTFLALDLLMPTDRFADFIRRFTLRAGSAGFSIKDADLLFRRYDVQHEAFGRTARRVLAGLERLLYVTPFEVRQITEALRQEDFDKVRKLLKRCVQDFLERSGIGVELLGAEPLRLLIEYLVLKDAKYGRKATLARFRPQADLIVTATNLNKGELCVFGMDAAEGKPPEDVNLMEALRASSAFPGVFRPRSFAEVTPYQTCGEMLVDGGVTDNLPLYSIARFITAASDSRQTYRRPTPGGRSVPHLLLTASLEPKWSKLGNADAETVAISWMKVRKRTAQLRYNRTADSFAKAQRDIRAIWNSDVGPPRWTPIDLEVVTVKPEWLPPTFGFHPMLGFRRELQAESIAHGCASTIAKLAHIEEIGPGWRAGDWGFSVDDILPNAVPWNKGHRDLPAWTREPELEPVATVSQPEGDPELEGRCWFRGHKTCPFFAPEDRPADERELHAIYLACGKKSTHVPRT
jgi:predicted acylesterase/phospholipase RssA